MADRDFLTVLRAVTPSPSEDSTRVPTTGWVRTLLAGFSSTKTFRTVHTFSIPGSLAVASGATDFIPPFFVEMASGQTVKLAYARCKLRAGTATLKIQRNGVDVTGFTGISATSSVVTTDPADVTLAAADLLALVVTVATGADGLSFTIVLEHTF